MDPKLKAILAKAKAIDKAAQKYDTVPVDVIESRVSSRKGSTSGLLDEVDRATGGGGQSYSPVDVYSEEYNERVSNSKLPPEIQKAMKENPIPQPSMVEQITEDDIRDLNPELYSEEDEYDVMETKNRKPQPSRRVNITENREPVNQPVKNTVSERQIRKMIAEEIAKALPGIVENYFDKKVIQENMRIMKHVLKNR